jgi:hypothetical protein
MEKYVEESGCGQLRNYPTSGLEELRKKKTSATVATHQDEIQTQNH